MKKFSLLILMACPVITALPLQADPATVAPSAPAAITKLPPSRLAGEVERPIPSNGSRMPLTLAETNILNKARMAVRMDPEIVDLNAQIKALVDKRVKLMEEKLQKNSPEAAAILQRMKDYQEKQRTDRQAKLEEMEAQYKAAQAAAALAQATTPPSVIPSPKKPQ